MAARTTLKGIRGTGRGLIRVRRLVAAGLLAPGFLVGSLSLTPSAWAESSPAAMVVADRDIQRQIEDEATTLIEANITVPCAALADQAQRAMTWAEALILPAPAEQPLEPDGVYEATCRGTVVVASLYLCGNCDRNHANCASGFVLTEDGLVVTNHHVLETNRSNITMVVRTFDGRVLPVTEVVAADPANDLAILRIPQGDYTTLPLGDRPRVGQRVHAITHPDRRFYFYSSGEVSQLRRHNGQGDGQERVSITALFAKGSSGGPIVDDAGNVVAIATSTRSVYYTEQDGVQQNLQMVFRDCIPVGKLRNLIRTVFADAS